MRCAYVSHPTAVRSILQVTCSPSWEPAASLCCKLLEQANMLWSQQHGQVVSLLRSRASNPNTQSRAHIADLLVLQANCFPSRRQQDTTRASKCSTNGTPSRCASKRTRTACGCHPQAAEQTRRPRGNPPRDTSKCWEPSCCSSTLESC